MKNQYNRKNLLRELRVKISAWTPIYGTLIPPIPMHASDCLTSDPVSQLSLFASVAASEAKLKRPTGSHPAGLLKSA